MQESAGKGRIYPGHLSTYERDRTAAEKKSRMVEALKRMVAKRLEADPGFNISHKSLEEMRKENPDAFFGINKGSNILRHFGDDMNFLRQKLGLPEIKSSRKEDL